MFPTAELDRLAVRYPALPYVAPFVAFLLATVVGHGRPPGPGFWYPVSVALGIAFLLLFSRQVLTIRISRFAGSILLGAAIFAVWVAPDLLWPSYRTHLLFQNGLTGEVHSHLPDFLRTSVWFLALRAGSSVLLVPLVEELFWRAWLMRYAVSKDFERVPFGTYSAPAFWITAALFASEHGPYWDVGLLAGIAYNWWMVRTRSLGDCILAHTVTNALLAAYVIGGGHWQYWL